MTRLVSVPDAWCWREADLTALQSWQQLLGLLVERAGTDLDLEEREALWTFLRAKADHELLPA